ncbi:MAG: DUF7577 domain-containing protein [Candidatus Xenobia bacterium]
MRCSHCGSLNPAKASFCRGCGGPLEGAAMPPGSPVATAAAPGAWRALPLPAVSGPGAPALPVLPLAIGVLVLTLGALLWALRPIARTAARSAPPVAAAVPQAPAWLGLAVLCRDLDADLAPLTPVDRYRPHDVLHCSIALQNAPAGQALEAQWCFGSTTLKISRHVLEHSQPSGHVAFSLQAGQPWPAGDYHVDIRVDGTAVKSIAFKVAP